jgi:hypothetical protein
MAKVTGAELLRGLRAEADRISGIVDRLRQTIETVTDPTAAEAEVEAARAAAEERAAAAKPARPPPSNAQPKPPMASRRRSRRGGDGRADGRGPGPRRPCGGSPRRRRD